MKVLAIFAVILVVVASYPLLRRPQLSFNLSGSIGTRPRYKSNRYYKKSTPAPYTYAERTQQVQPMNYNPSKTQARTNLFRPVLMDYGYDEYDHKFDTPSHYAGPPNYSDFATDPNDWIDYSRSRPQSHPDNDFLYLSRQDLPMQDNKANHIDLASSTILPEMERHIGPKVKTWTAKEIFDALYDQLEFDLLPYIKEAADQFLHAIFTNTNWSNVLAAIPSPSGQKNWKIQEIEQFSEIPAVDEEFRAALDHAHKLYIDLKKSNPYKDIPPIPVVIGAVDISTWNTLELKHALRDPTTRPELKAYIKQALDELEHTASSKLDTISIITPVGLIANNPEYYELTILPELLDLLEKEAQEFDKKPDPMHYRPYADTRKLYNSTRRYLKKKAYNHH